MFKKLVISLLLAATVLSLGFAASPVQAAALPASHNNVLLQDDGDTPPTPTAVAPTADDANTRADHSESTTLGLSDDANTRVDHSEGTTLSLAKEIGKMADRIGEMADRILFTEGLIVKTEFLIASFIPRQ